MERCKFLPVALQEHHVSIGREIIEESETIEIKKEATLYVDQLIGYFRNQKEREELIKALTIALEGLVSGNFTPMEDGRPDVICMGCFRNDGGCSIPIEYRDKLRPTWKVMRRQIHGL